MANHIVKRLLLTVPLVLVISFITFLLTRLSQEDPEVVILHAQEVPVITDKLLTETREKYGLNDPLFVQYWHWLVDALHFNFGHSFVTGTAVSETVGPALFNTLKLTMVASTVIIVMSLLLGVVSALLRDTWVDRVIRTSAFITTAIPSYWLGTLMIIYVSVKLNLVPTSGMSGMTSYILPVCAIALGYIGIYFRNVRSAMIEQLDQDYVLYARAMGIPSMTLMFQMLRNALQVVVSIFCMAIPIILSGSVVVENIFAWPGMGQVSVKAVLEQDFPVIQAYVLIISVLFVILNMVADIINAYLNPRLREGL